MYKWFRDCKTAEQGKCLYRQLVKRFHPDNGSTGEELKEISAEFKTWWNFYKDIHDDKASNFYQERESTDENINDFMDIITKLSTLPNIEIEICGKWLWISGNTYPVKEQLKDFGCGYSRSKKKWYWTGEQLNHKYFKTKSMKSIRNIYGSEKVHINTRPCLEC